MNEYRNTELQNDILTSVWPDWKIVKKLGGGTFGDVYEAVRTDLQTDVHSAIKVITIPRNEAELNSLRTNGMTEDVTRSYVDNWVKDCIDEIKMMETFKGLQNIVSVEDYKVVRLDDQIRWRIFIRMELLTPLNEYLGNRQMTETEVIKLGSDICSALIACSKKKVIHRDIKPGNILVNDFGDFKLADFGIARTMENATGDMSHKGTYNYMAPEVERSPKYDSTVDLYSLGLVLYQFMNHRRLPLIVSDEQASDPKAVQSALRRRLNGEELPPPCDASLALSSVILKACAYDPHDRFSSAQEMKDALMKVPESQEIWIPEPENDRTRDMWGAGVDDTDYEMTRDLWGTPADHHDTGISGSSIEIPRADSDNSADNPVADDLSSSTHHIDERFIHEKKEIIAAKKPKSFMIVIIAGSIAVLFGIYLLLSYLKVLPDSISVFPNKDDEIVEETSRFSSYKVILFRAPESRLELKAEPDEKSLTITDVDAADVFTVDQETESGWGHISFGESAGWIQLQYTMIVGDYTPQAPSSETIDPVFYRVKGTDEDGLILRLHPTEVASAVGFVKEGTVVGAVASENGWALVNVDNMTGWADMTWLQR